MIFSSARSAARSRFPRSTLFLALCQRERERGASGNETPVNARWKTNVCCRATILEILREFPVFTRDARIFSRRFAQLAITILKREKKNCRRRFMLSRILYRAPLRSRYAIFFAKKRELIYQFAVTHDRVDQNRCVCVRARLRMRFILYFFSSTRHRYAYAI